MQRQVRDLFYAVHELLLELHDLVEPFRMLVAADRVDLDHLQDELVYLLLELVGSLEVADLELAVDHG